MGLREEADRAAGILRTVGTGAMPATPGYGTDGNGDELADVAESGIEASTDVPVHVAWQKVMQDVQWLGKNRVTETGTRYRYRGIDDVMNVVGPALRKHGVFVAPTGIEPTFTTINTKAGAVMNYCRAVVHFTVYGPKGDSFTASVLGEAFDNGDKSGTKAQSIALRTFLVNGLAIQTNEPERDTEYGTQHELAAPPRPTPEQYAEWILDESTSLGRLTQIKNELYADKSVGAAEVELPDGEKVRLVDLVRRVGQQRKSGEATA